MQGRIDAAEAYFKQGYNCAQAVALAYADRLGMDEGAAARISEAFGGGMGRMREVCGAVSGMLMVLGAARTGGGQNPEERKKLYALTQECMDEFRRRAGSYVCGELLDLPGKSGPVPEPRTEEYYTRRPCAEYVRMAARITAKAIGEA